MPTMDGVPPRQDPGRARGQAGPPTPSSTQSYWHRDPSQRLKGHRTTKELPSAADVVVVGSGITGTFAAMELVRGGRSVVMLDAREACWGATGRNGGHCQPGIWDSPIDVARFELATFNIIKDLVAEHEIPCDWRVVGGVHPIFSSEVLEIAKQRINRLQQHSDLKDKAVLIQDSEKLAILQVPLAKAAVYQPDAAKLWPYKLVTWILERLIDQHDAAVFNLQTNTVVERLERRASSWILHTTRGPMEARDVLLASNAYTSHLLPNMTGLIIPVRGQVCALTLPPGAKPLPHSYVWMKGADHQYLIQRELGDTQVQDRAKVGQDGDRSLVFGGERLAATGGEECVSADDEVNPAVSQALHKGLHDAVRLAFKDGTAPDHAPDMKPLSAAYEWTGIMGYASDGQPWIGRVPPSLLEGLETTGHDVAAAGSRGLWIAAGFTGHGMPVAAQCGMAAADKIMGKEEGIKLPAGWLASEQRISQARGRTIPQSLDEIVQDLKI